MSEENEANNLFHSPTRGALSFEAGVARIKEYLEEEPKYQYRLVIGTDSEGKNHAGAHFVTALVVHRVGGGGIYFWKKCFAVVHSLRERIYHEATLSLEFAQQLLATLSHEDFSGYDFEIHVDVGQGGETRELITEVVGMIKGSGFNVKTKPESYGASCVADRHSK